MKNFLLFTSGLLLVAALGAPHTSNAAPLTNEQANSLIGVVQSSPDTPASAFTNLITAFSNITVAQAESLITVVQASSGAPANAFVGLLVAFTVDPQKPSADSVNKSTTTDSTPTNEPTTDSATTPNSTSASPDIQVTMRSNYLEAAPGADEHKLAELEVQADEDVVVNKSVFEIKIFKDGGQATDIRNVVLVDSKGNVLAGPMDVTADRIATLSDAITIKKGTHRYHLRASLADSFTSEQTIGILPLKEKWSIQREEEKESFIPPFISADIFVHISSVETEPKDDGTRTAHLTIESQTDLTDLYIKMMERESGTTVLSKSATRVDGSNVYEVSVSDIVTGVYDLKLIADATQITGTSHTFEESIGIE